MSTLFPKFVFASSSPGSAGTTTPVGVFCFFCLLADFYLLVVSPASAAVGFAAFEVDLDLGVVGEGSGESVLIAELPRDDSDLTSSCGWRTTTFFVTFLVLGVDFFFFGFEGGLLLLLPPLLLLFLLRQ